MIGRGKKGMLYRTVAGLLLISFLVSGCVTPNQVRLTSPVPGAEFVVVDKEGTPLKPNRVLVAAVDQDSPAAEAGIRPDEVLASINGEAPKTAAHAAALLADATEAVLKLGNPGAEREAALQRKGLFGISFKNEFPTETVINARGYETTLLATHRDYRPYIDTIKPTKKIGKDKYWASGGLLLFFGFLSLIISSSMPETSDPGTSYEQDNSGAKSFFTLWGLACLAGGVPLVAVGNARTYENQHTVYDSNLAALAIYDAEGINPKTGVDRFGIAKNGVYPNGARFDGSLVEGKREGYGSMISPDGKFALAGVFQADALNGLGKELDLTDPGNPRLLFLGLFEAGKRSGAGIEFGGNGKPAFLVTSREGIEQARVPYPAQPLRESADLLFLGEGFAKGLAEGKGLALRMDGGESLEGTFRSGELVEGLKRHADGTQLQGTFEQGALMRGTLRRPDGSGGEGIWKDGRLQSPGKVMFADGRVFTGSFDSESIGRGEGTMAYPDGSQYTGGLANQVPHGKGKLKTNDGTVYEGSFVNGNAQGEGKLTYANGESYEGSFNAGVPHGMGIFRSGSAVERAEYIEGQRVDQVYLMRVERDRIAEEARSREERRRAEEAAAERERLEEQRRQKEEQRLAEERQRNQDFWKKAASAAGGLAVTGIAGSHGIADDLAVELGVATAKDIYEGGTSNLDALKAKTESETARSGAGAQTRSSPQQSAPRMAVAPPVLPGLAPAAPAGGGGTAQSSGTVSTGGNIVGTWRNTSGVIVKFDGNGKFTNQMTKSVNGNPGILIISGTYSYDPLTQTLNYTIDRTELTGSAGYDTVDKSVKSYSEKATISGSTLSFGGGSYTRSGN